MKVHSVTGAFDPQAVQKTMIHEHLVFNLSGVRQDNDSILEDSPEMDREMESIIASGCNTVVEVSNIGMGRNPQGLAALARKHNLLIVASTGFYKEQFYPSFVFERSAEELAEMMVREILVGMDDTNIKAGLIAEIGSSFKEITAAEEWERNKWRFLKNMASR
jgi:phosphotriesterase-related protein